MLCKHGADDTQSNTSESQLSHGLGGDLGQGLWSLRGLVFSPVNWNQESLSYLPYQVVVKKKKKTQKKTDKQVIKGESKELTLGAESSWHYCYLRLRTLLRPPQQKHGWEQAQADARMGCTELWKHGCSERSAAWASCPECPHCRLSLRVEAAASPPTGGPGQAQMY